MLRLNIVLVIWKKKCTCNYLKRLYFEIFYSQINICLIYPNTLNDN